MLEFVLGVCWCSCWLLLVVLGVCWCTFGVSVDETLPGVRQLGSLASCAKEELKSNFQKKCFTLLGVLYSPVGPINTCYISAKETIWDFCTMLGSKCANCGNDPSLKHHNLVMCFRFQLTDSRILRYDQTSQRVEKYDNWPQKVQIMRNTFFMKIIRNILYSHNEHTQRFCLPLICSLALGRCSLWRSWCLSSARRSSTYIDR